MATIFESPNFIVESQEQPFLPRTDGGHVRIRVKDASIRDRTMLDPKQAIELMRLSMIVGGSLERAMNLRGIPVIKVNYQDMGNWYAKRPGDKPFLHYHIFGRASNASKQPWPESMYLPDRGTGFYAGFEPLNEEDRGAILVEIERTLKLEKYALERWGL